MSVKKWMKQKAEILTSSNGQFSECAFILISAFIGLKGMDTPAGEIILT